MQDAVLAWRVEEACLNSWPALRQALFAGWVLRFSGGLTRRANSANPLGIERADPDALTLGCEALYRHHRQPTIFRLPSLIGPAVDDRLAARGYGSEGLSLVLYSMLGEPPAAPDAAVRLLPRPSTEWLAAIAAMQRQTRRQATLYRRIVGALALPAAFAMLSEEDGVAALAFGAIHDRLMCLQSVATDPRRQRRGYARRIIASLCAWAVEHGAVGVCLEVEAANAPALALYHALGFDQLYDYHYRREPIPAPHRPRGVSPTRPGA